MYELMGVDFSLHESSLCDLSYLPPNTASKDCSVGLEAGNTPLIPVPLSCLEMSPAQLLDKVNTVVPPQYHCGVQVRSVFTRLDTNQDGVLSKEEFIQGCLQVYSVVYCSSFTVRLCSGPRDPPLPGELPIQYTVNESNKHNVQFPSAVTNKEEFTKSTQG